MMKMQVGVRISDTSYTLLSVVIASNSYLVDTLQISIHFPCSCCLATIVTCSTNMFSLRKPSLSTNVFANFCLSGITMTC